MQCSSYIHVYYNARDVNGYARRLYDDNVEERGRNDLGYDKEVWKQIIKNHEATFRYQVEELHRLYRRQRELMDEMRMREIFAGAHLLSTSQSIDSLSPAGAELSHPATNWLFGNLASSKLSELPSQRPKNCNDDARFLSPSCNGNGNENGIVSHDDQRKQPASDSDFGLNMRKRNCLIDLNKQPVQLESLKSDDDGMNLSMAIDLNSTPVNCYSETEMTLESPPATHREAEVCVDEPIAHNNLIKSETQIDLNTGVVGVELEHYPPLELKSAELKGPVSPENEESSPPRGESEDIQMETPLDTTTIAAHTLLQIFSLTNFSNLRWLAHFVSSAGDELENEVMNGQGEENALNLSRFSKLKGRKKQHKHKGLEELGKKRRKPGRNGCRKPRKYPNKSMSTILKSWGTIRKRQGGRRCRATNCFSLPELASF